MKIKRVATLLMALGLLALPTACNSSSPEAGSSLHTNSSSYSGGGNENGNGQSGGGNSADSSAGGESSNKYTGAITNALAFSEGYTFISDETTHTAAAILYGRPLQICVDRQGNEVFRLSGEDVCRAGFKNGNALVDLEGEGGLSLMNAKGEVVASPKKSGYTDVVGVYAQNGGMPLTVEMYQDGYLPVYNEKATFEGTTYEYGILSANGEWILELSDEHFLSENVPKGFHLGQTFEGYYNGYIRFSGEANGNYYAFTWNLRNGSFTEDEYNLDDWFRYSIYSGTGEKGKFYDVLDRVVLDIQGKYPTLQRTGDYLSEAACTNAHFYNNQTLSYYFSLMDRQGELLFEPYVLKKCGLNYASVDMSYGLADMDGVAKIFYAVKENGDLLIYDKQGNLKQEFSSLISSNVTSLYVRGSLDDEVYMIYETYDGLGRDINCYYIDAQGEVILGNK